MASDWETVCDAIATDLTTNVASLTAASVHKYAPWNPEEAFAQQGERHLAVWPVAEAESKDSLATGFHELVQSYVVMVWEDASDSQERRVEDPTADKAFLQVHNDTRARFYVSTNQTIGGSELVWYAGTTFAEGSGLIRWFAIRLDVRRIIGFT